MRPRIMTALCLGLGLQLAAQAQISQEPPVGPLRPDQVAFRALYKELVETNTSLSVGSWATHSFGPRERTKPEGTDKIGVAQ